MQRLVRPTAGCVIVAALSGLAGCARECSDHPEPSVRPANEWPIRTLDLDGRPHEFWKPEAPATVVLFTRTDCPIANRYAPDIRRLYEQYHPRGVNFFQIYVDPHETADAIRQHLRDYRYPCPGLRDPEHTLVAFCHATATPEAVVFGKDRVVTYQGRIDDRYVDLGRPRDESSTHDLADAIDATVAGRPVAVPRTKAVGCLIADVKD
jgi:hypothetical protein